MINFLSENEKAVFLVFNYFNYIRFYNHQSSCTNHFLDIISRTQWLYYHV